MFWIWLNYFSFLNSNASCAGLFEWCFEYDLIIFLSWIVTLAVLVCLTACALRSRVPQEACVRPATTVHTALPTLFPVTVASTVPALLYQPLQVIIIVILKCSSSTTSRLWIACKIVNRYYNIICNNYHYQYKLIQWASLLSFVIAMNMNLVNTLFEFIYQTHIFQFIHDNVSLHFVDNSLFNATFLGNCSRGYYCNGTSSTPTQYTCPQGHYCQEGSPVPTPCPPGTYANKTHNDDLGDCINCTSGMYCQGKSMEISTVVFFSQ